MSELYVITGGAGFIGSNLCERLLNEGHHVRCLDNFSTGRRDNIEPFLSNSQFDLIEADICDYDACFSACEGADYVLHQAAWGSVPRSIQMPLFYEEVNIRGTLNMLEAARQREVRRFVYASSSSVYGDEPNLPKKEGREGNLLSPYAVTKTVNEKYAALYTSLYGLETVGLRYFNVFGRRQDPGGAYAAVIPKFLSLLLAGERPVINGDGKQTRDFTYIDNVLDANLLAAHAGSSSAGKVYNVATGGRETLIDVYSLLCKALGVEIEPLFGENRIGDIRDSFADISAAQRDLNFEPRFSFREGIEHAIDWYRDNLV